jgi:hypothetical protein
MQGKRRLRKRKLNDFDNEHPQKCKIFDMNVRCFKMLLGPIRHRISLYKKWPIYARTIASNALQYTASPKGNGQKTQVPILKIHTASRCSYPKALAVFANITAVSDVPRGIEQAYLMSRCLTIMLMALSRRIIVPHECEMRYNWSFGSRYRAR